MSTKIVPTKFRQPKFGQYDHPKKNKVDISLDALSGQPSIDIYSKSYEYQPPNQQFLESVEARRESKELEAELFEEQQKLFNSKKATTSYGVDDQVFLKREFSESSDKVLERDPFTGKLRKKTPTGGKSSNKVFVFDFETHTF